MPAPQSAQSHTAMNPITHFTLMPIFFITLGVAIYVAARSPVDRVLHLWLVVVAAALVLLNIQTRLYALRLQDRIIRLEEHVRLAALLPPLEAAEAVSRLTGRQLIALRFAPDSELPALVARTLTEGLTPPAIKQAIVTWRADHSRV